MYELLIKRILAFTIDYIVIVIWALILFGSTKLIGVNELSPSKGQLVGFFTLTLPVFLYFFIFEGSHLKATPGKILMKIAVLTKPGSKNKSIFIRNFLKFLPWEIAHFGVHWMIYYSTHDVNIPPWIWFVLIIPQFTVLIYFVSMIVCKGKRSLYDKLANTSIEIKNEEISH